MVCFLLRMCATLPVASVTVYRKMSIMSRHEAEALIRVLIAFKRALIDMKVETTVDGATPGRLFVHFEPSSKLYGMRGGSRRLVLDIDVPVRGPILIYGAKATPGPVPFDTLACAVTRVEAAWLSIGGPKGDIGKR